MENSSSKSEPFELVVYDMTNVEPDDREKINHQLNEIYLRNTLDKNNPIESYLALHVLPSEKSNIEEILTSNFKFQPVAPGSDTYNMVANQNNGTVNAVVTDAKQIIGDKSSMSDESNNTEKAVKSSESTNNEKLKETEGNVGQKGGKITNHLKSKSRRQSRKSRNIPYLERQYKPRITSTTNRKTKHKKTE